MRPEYQDVFAQVIQYKPLCEELVAKLSKQSLSPDLCLYPLFNSSRKAILQAWDFATLLAKDPLLKGISLQELAALNAEFFADVKPQHGYEQSLSNPDVNTRLFGEQMGGLAGAVYTGMRAIRQYLVRENYLEIASQLQLYYRLFELAEKGNCDYHDWLKAYRAASSENLELKTLLTSYQSNSPEADAYAKIILSADLSDLRYLYRFGVYLSEYDFAMAEFVNSYPETELSALAKFIVQSWVDGFVRAKKDYRIKRFANVMIPAGMERLGKMLINELKSIGLEALLSLPKTNGINRQLAYDHRFDNALSMDRDIVENKLKIGESVMEQMQDLILAQAGPVYVMLFGETPFSPVAKSTALKLSDEQQKLSCEFSARNAQIYYKYYRRDESSFTIIAFPSPEIGIKFPEIFADTLKINLLDSQHYANIQQKIIDVLDKADYVHVKGKAGNDTDIRVKMHSLSDPQGQTLFENCVADVNIPVGEVFTSPLLKGTNGTLHVEDIYLGSLRYHNLRINFKDGWIESYSCSNFADPAEGKKYIHENLLLPHQSLPIGEFAIGTNTTAYQIARKHDILSLLPILIIEKMGPHFAIGDTCYSHEEDAPHPNFLNGKEMIAVENEKSATRKEDPLNAYTQKHMDITLPYEMLESISAITLTGESLEIIRDGRFVVPGTEELNLPLDEGW